MDTSMLKCPASWAAFKSRLNPFQSLLSKGKRTVFQFSKISLDRSKLCPLFDSSRPFLPSKILMSSPVTLDLIGDIVRRHQNLADENPVADNAHFGQVFKADPPEDLAEIFPRHALLPFEQPSFNWEKWHCTPITWPTPLPRWNAWVNRLCPAFGRQWDDMGVTAFIELTTRDIYYDPSVLPAIMSFWNRSFNFFHLPVGLMSITLMDITALTGLPVDGELVFSVMPLPETEEYHMPKHFSFQAFIELSMDRPGSPAEAREHIAFFLCLICRFMMCLPGKACSTKYIRLALGQFLLGALYRGLNNISGNPLGSLGGPMWVAQLWAYLYFPAITPNMPFIITA